MLQITDRRHGDMIHGSTDTEHFAALYFSCLDALYKNTDNPIEISDVEKRYTAHQMREALIIAISQVLVIQKKHFGTILDNDLNFCTSMCPAWFCFTGAEDYAIADGESLVAIRYHSNPLKQSPTLFVSFTVADKLNRKLNNKVYKDSHSALEIDNILARFIDDPTYASKEGSTCG